MAAHAFAAFLLFLFCVGGGALAWVWGGLFPRVPGTRFMFGLLALGMWWVFFRNVLPHEELVDPAFVFTCVGFVGRSGWELMLRHRDRAVAYENAAREMRAQKLYEPGDILDTTA